MITLHHFLLKLSNKSKDNYMSRISHLFKSNSLQLNEVSQRKCYIFFPYLYYALNHEI